MAFRSPLQFSFTLNILDNTVRKDLSRCRSHDKLLAIKMGQFDGYSCEGIQEGDLLLDEQISSSPLIDLVLIYQDSNVEIACHHPGLD